MKCRIAKEEIYHVISEVKGKVGLYIKNLDTAEALFMGERESMVACSIIKIPISVMLLQNMINGAVDPLKRVYVNKNEIVGGTGIISGLSPGSSFTWYDLMMLMITISDNTATNLIIDFLGMDKINDFFRKTGLKDTRLERKMFDLDAIKAGRNNYTTAKDMGFLLTLLADGKSFDPEVSEVVLNVMKRQIYANKLPALIPALPYYEVEQFSTDVPEGRVMVANKTGELPGIQHDIGVFKLPSGQRYVIAMLTSGLADDQEGVAAIAKVSSLVYESFR